MIIVGFGCGAGMLIEDGVRRIRSARLVYGFRPGD